MCGQINLNQGGAEDFFIQILCQNFILHSHKIQRFKIYVFQDFVWNVLFWVWT
jgi:hypothetical protein